MQLWLLANQPLGARHSVDAEMTALLARVNGAAEMEHAVALNVQRLVEPHVLQYISSLPPDFADLYNNQLAARGEVLAIAQMMLVKNL